MKASNGSAAQRVVPRERSLFTALVIVASLSAPFLIAELSRNVFPRAATVASMIGWLAIVTCTFTESLRAFGSERVLRFLQSWILVFAVLSTYLWHSGLARNGVWVDLIYTYDAARAFLELANPITFMGTTHSYVAFFGYILIHLPAIFIGFPTLLGFSYYLGPLLLVALLLALAVHAFVASSRYRWVCLVLLSASFCDTLLIQSFNSIIYSFPALGFAVLVLAYAVRPRLIFFLSSVTSILSMSLQYAGFFFLSPLLALGTFRELKRKGLRSVVASSVLTLTILCIFAVSYVVARDELMRRVDDIVKKNSSTQSAPFAERLAQRAKELPEVARAKITATYLKGGANSWFLRPEASLSLHALWLNGIGLILLLVTLSAKRMTVVVAGLAYSAAAVLALMLVSDYADYRMYFFFFGALVLSKFFILRLHAIRHSWLRVSYAGFALVSAFVNWRDIGRYQVFREHGIYTSGATQPLLENLIDVADSTNLLSSSGNRVYIVREDFCPLCDDYLSALQSRSGADIQFVTRGALCGNPLAFSRDVVGRIYLVHYTPWCPLPSGVPFPPLFTPTKILPDNGAIITVNHASDPIQSLVNFDRATLDGWEPEGDFLRSAYMGDREAPLAYQQPVRNVAKRYYINTYVGGDTMTGRILSPSFVVTEELLVLSVAGGHYPDSAFVGLLVDGKIVRKATGDDSEAFRLVAWNVEEFQGQEAKLIIVDSETNSFGHIMLSAAMLVGSSASR